MGHKNYSNFSKHFNKNAEQNKEVVEATEVLDGQITIEEVNNDTHVVSPELEQSVINAGGEVMRVEQNEPVEPTVKFKKGVVTGCDRLNMRKRPSKEAELVTILDKGTVVTVNLTEATTEDFYKVMTSTGHEGYCMKKFITIE